MVGVGILKIKSGEYLAAGACKVRVKKHKKKHKTVYVLLGFGATMHHIEHYDGQTATISRRGKKGKKVTLTVLLQLIN